MKKKSLLFITLVMFFYLSVDAQHKIYSFNGITLGTSMAKVDCGDASSFGWVVGVNMGFFHFDVSSNSAQVGGKPVAIDGDYVFISDKVSWNAYNLGVNLELNNYSLYRFIFTPKVGLFISQDIDLDVIGVGTYIVHVRDNEVNYGLDVSLVIPSTNFHITCGTSIKQPLTVSIGYRFGSPPHVCN